MKHGASSRFLVGKWRLTLSGAWFLDDLETEQHGEATFEWLGDAFVVMTSSMEGAPVWDLVNVSSRSSTET